MTPYKSNGNAEDRIAAVTGTAVKRDLYKR